MNPWPAYAVDTIITTETYADRRAKEAARHGTFDSPVPEPQEDTMYISCFFEATPYGHYTAETTSTSYIATDLVPESPWKQKLSLPSPFKKKNAEKKQLAELADTTRGPAGPPDSSKGFFPKLQIRRPRFVRRNAFWRGKSREEPGHKVMVDALMTGTGICAATGAPVAAIEGQPQPERASMAQRRPLDMSEAQEERPQKRTRVAAASSFAEDFGKFGILFVRE